MSMLDLHFSTGDNRPVPPPVNPTDTPSAANLPEGSVDWKVLQQLRSRRRNGRSAFARLLPIFQDEASLIIVDIRAATATGDATGVRLAAHKLKGSASVLGSLQVKHESQAILEAATEGHLPSDEALESLNQAVSAFVSFALSLPDQP